MNRGWFGLVPIIVVALTFLVVDGPGYWRSALREMVIDIRFAWRFRGKKFYIMGIPVGPLTRRTYKRVYGSPYNFK